jgi:ribosome-binding factor A
MPREFPRSRRIEEAIKRILSQALASEARDPRLESVVVTDVSVSGDLSVAHIYYTRLKGESADPEIATALRAAGGFLRSAVARELRAKHVPELRFHPDESMARGRTLADLIDQAVASDRRAGESE